MRQFDTILINILYIMNVYIIHYMACVISIPNDTNKNIDMFLNTSSITINYAIAHNIIIVGRYLHTNIKIYNIICMDLGQLIAWSNLSRDNIKK